MTFANRVGHFVAEHPVLVAVVFGGVLAGSVPALVGVQVYLSIYELSPRAEYYDHFVILNRDLGWDNLGAVLMTRTPAREGVNVTDPASIRAMNELELELEKLEFVEGALSLAEIVRILNGRIDFAVGQYVPGGVPEVPILPPETQPKSQVSGFPEEGPDGDARINASMQIALNLLGDQIYGNILARDHQSALMIVVMETGATGTEYREWQEIILEKGLSFQGAPTHQYRGELEYRPLSIDIIYSTLDTVAVEESPYWIGAALVAGLTTVGFLFRRFSEPLIAVIVLVVVVAATLSVAVWRGIDFNLLSLLVAALIFAAGVDYSMHVTARYREERSLGYDSRTALLHTIRASGPPLLITSITTTAGFMSLYFSLIPAIGDFGVMVGAAIFMAFIVCTSLLPVLLVWADRLRGDTAGTEAPPEKLEARRREIEARVRDEQRRSPLGRLGATLARRHRHVIAASLLATLVVASPFITHGIEVWGASYLEPHAILEEETYSMQALRAMDATFGIPNEMAVLFYGDPTHPRVVKYLDKLQVATNDVHGRSKTDSIPNVLRLYTTIINPDPAIDRDDDGIPDTQGDIRRAFDQMRDDPATSLLVNRVVVYDATKDEYVIAAHRLGINPQPPGSLGSDVDNYRRSVEDVQTALAALEADEREAGLSHGTTGLVVLATEVVDAIIRGNALSVVVMLAVVYVILVFFWRKPTLAAIGMIPILAAVLVQYSLTALLGYEVTYVSLILTGMVMGIGVDDAVHYINRFREEIRNGRRPEDAATLASAEIGSVLVGTTFTTMAPFVAILFSVITWAVQTALLVIPTLLAALAATIFTLPAVLAWHARVRPGAYGVTPGERLGERAEAAAERVMH